MGNTAIGGCSIGLVDASTRARPEAMGTRHQAPDQSANSCTCLQLPALDWLMPQREQEPRPWGPDIKPPINQRTAALACNCKLVMCPSRYRGTYDVKQCSCSLTW